jgi:hypothetical protein
MSDVAKIFAVGVGIGLAVYALKKLSENAKDVGQLNFD